MHLVDYLYEDYHDARSLEHKVNVCICEQTEKSNKTAQLMRNGAEFGSLSLQIELSRHQ